VLELPLEPQPLLGLTAYDKSMLLIELAILDVLLILTAFVCFTYVSNRNARVGAGAGILALGLAVITTFPFFPVIGIGICISLIGLWILSLRPPQKQITEGVDNQYNNSQNDINQNDIQPNPDFQNDNPQ
jgi:hypothetical protein